LSKECKYCGRPNSEIHHRIYRSEVKALEKCKANLVYLCPEHHRGTNSPHGKYGEKINRELRLEFQNWLEINFLKSEYDLEEIQQILGISINAVRSLCKLMKLDKGKYTRETIIRACMAGKMIEEGE
jgi:hypothetical protein